MFPWVLYSGLILVIVLLLLNLLKWKKKDTYKEGNKVTNTSFLEETPYYKQLYKKYKIYCSVSLISLIFAILMCSVLLARPAMVQTENPEIHNRDIFLCMDASNSVDQLNIEIVDKLKDVVKKLDGERFGITIFNGKAVLLVPLTTDYDYVLDTLDKLEESMKYSLTLTEGNYDIDNVDYSLYYYKHNGTLVDNGSSFIGDGLASCLYNFSDLEENTDRSRLIVFTTDNELNGTPFVSLQEAAELCKKNDVKVFAITPDNVVDKEEFQAAIESTDGKFYEVSDKKTFQKLVDDIEKTETSAMEEVKTIYIDRPQLFFTLLLLFTMIHFIVSRKVKL